eukprot:c10926_g1_i1.p1 GENE.c10926_g1_i1~~c10926_g1_i1.p1  ORF type:complete len:273 (-),score=47.76 c10926_g1_i1:79-897(-)
MLFQWVFLLFLCPIVLPKRMNVLKFRTEIAASRALDFLEAVIPTHKHVAADLVVGFESAACLYQHEYPKLHTRAHHLALRVAHEYLYTQSSLPDVVGPTEVRGALGNIFALRMVGLDDALVEQELQSVLPHFNDTIVLGFDIWALEQAKTKNLFPGWLLFSRALVVTMFLDFFMFDLGKSQGHDVQDSRYLQVLRWLPHYRKQYVHLEHHDKPHSVVLHAQQAMLVTHLVYTLTQYSPLLAHPHLQVSLSELLKPEVSFLQSSLPRFMALRR